MKIKWVCSITGWLKEKLTPVFVLYALSCYILGIFCVDSKFKLFLPSLTSPSQSFDVYLVCNSMCFESCNRRQDGKSVSDGMCKKTNTGCNQGPMNQNILSPKVWDCWTLNRSSWTSQAESGWNPQKTLEKAVSRDYKWFPVTVMLVTQSWWWFANVGDRIQILATSLEC